MGTSDVFVKGGTPRTGARLSVPLLMLVVMTMAGTAGAVDLMHNSTDTGSRKWAQGWGIDGGKYGRFTCQTCHKPDGDNIKNIRGTLRSPNGENWPNGSNAVTVSFGNTSSMGQDRGGHAASNRICEVCHSKVQFHNFNTANNTGGLAHPTPQKKCTSCHSHNTGFKAACGGCHGNPPTSPVLGGDYGLIGTPRPSNTLTPGEVGAHATHTQARSMVCDTCHYIDNGTIKMPNLSNSIDMGFFGFGGKVTHGTYVPYTSATRGFRIASGTANTTIAAGVTVLANANKCLNVYCHGGGVFSGSTQIKAPLTGGTNTTPRWDAAGQATCGSCHGTTAATPPTMGSHVKHSGSAAGYGYSCDFCHPVSGDNSHVQGNVRWQMKASEPKVGSAALYNGLPSGSTGDMAPSSSYGQCTNVACHSDGRGGAPRLDARWGDAAFNAECAGCHGGNGASAAPMASGMHGQHVNQASVNGVTFECVQCHAKTVSSDRVIAYRSNHNNQFVNFSGANAGKNKAACNAAYCHSDGKGAPGTAVSWTTGPAIANCVGCHGAAAPADFASAYGEPNYASTGGGLPRANSHKLHTAKGAITCVACHGATVTAAGSLNASGKHLDRFIDVDPGGGETFSYTRAGKTCATISCHGAGAPTLAWGAPASTDCTGCHGGNAAAAPKDLKSGKHAEHINQAAVNGENYGCVECHAQTVSSDRVVSATTLHPNKFVNYSGARAGKTSTACNTAYCHSDGKGTPGTAVSWTTGPALTNCIGCHGIATPADFPSLAGEPNYPSGGATNPRSNSHRKHVGTSGATTCVYCHDDTVAASGALNGSGKHIDRVIQVTPGGTKNFAFDQLEKSCATISCHGAGAPKAFWGSSMPADCTGCHGGNTGSANPIATGMHSQHIAQQTLNGESFGCVECHAQTVSGDRAVFSQGNHGNQFVNYSGVRAGKSPSSCATAYCHSDGKGREGAAVSWTTGPAIVNCIGCHGNDSTPDFTSIAGEPNYASAGAGLVRANSHRSHTTSGASTCKNCHITTVTTDGTAIQASGLHINGGMNVDFDKTLAGASSGYDYLSRTCNTIACHGGRSPRWGDAASAGCSACHPDLGGSHGRHIGDLLSAGLVGFYNFTGNRSSGAVYRFGCAICHPTDKGKHRNGQVDIDLSRNKVGAAYITTLNNQNDTDTAGYTRGTNSVTCETVYCHSNGRTLNLAAGDYRRSPDWYGGTLGDNRCGACHDNPPRYAGQSHYVADSNIGNNGQSPFGETGHMVGIHFLTTYVGNYGNGYLGYSSSGNKAHGNTSLASTISCSTCHSGIVSTAKIDTYAMDGTASQFRCGTCHKAGSRTPLQTGEIAGANLHVNGRKDVVFAPVNLKTKAQLSNVANALGWSRSGVYKAADSFDSADLSISTWDGATKTCLTACHVNQPNITWGTQLTCASCHANQ